MGAGGGRSDYYGAIVAGALRLGAEAVVNSAGGEAVLIAGSPI